MKNKYYIITLSSLNKLEGDVTMSIIVPKEIGNGWKFVKKTFKINELYKNPKLTILFVEGDKANLDNKKAKQKIINELIKRNIGNSKIIYRLKDWGISRK